MTINAGSSRFGPRSRNIPETHYKPEKKQPKAAPTAEPIRPHEEEIEEEVDLKGFQVVRREFFSHIREPSIIFNAGKISVNAACIRRLPDVEFVQILIHREKQMLAIKPCEELDLFSFQWGVTKEGKRFPRAVTGKLFFMKVCDLMGWNPNYRYKILGRLCRANGEYLFVFDLKSTETYERSAADQNGKRKSSRIPVFPLEWKDQFGIPFEEQHQALQINMFDGFTLFSLKETKKKPEETTETAPPEQPGKEE